MQKKHESLRLVVSQLRGEAREQLDTWGLDTQLNVTRKRIGSLNLPCNPDIRTFLDFGDRPWELAASTLPTLKRFCVDNVVFEYWVEDGAAILSCLMI